jgi:predicted RNase H-like HicB family nuclease
MSEYVVIYEQAEDGAWGAYLPDLPGVVALGSTREEVATRIQGALAFYVEYLRERGEELPAPHHAAGVVATQGVPGTQRVPGT